MVRVDVEVEVNLELVDTEDLLEELNDRGQRDPSALEGPEALVSFLRGKGVPEDILEVVHCWVESPTSALDWRN